MCDCYIYVTKLPGANTEDTLHVRKNKYYMSVDVEAILEIQNHQSNGEGRSNLHVWYAFWNTTYTSTAKLNNEIST